MNDLPVFVKRVDEESIPPEHRFKYCTWDKDTLILFEVADQMATHAEKLAHEAGVYHVTSTEYRSDYDGTSYPVTVINWFQVARIIHHVQTLQDPNNS